jgi:lactate dehydrogenase-like 2-hydroxyacid dehydrogenase
MKVHYFNRKQVSQEEEKALEATYHNDLKSMLSICDVLCLTCPLTDSTRGIIGEPEIACMKDGAFLVNTARGPVVDEKALIAALWSGKIARAGLDVFDNEPKIK